MEERTDVVGMEEIVGDVVSTENEGQKGSSKLKIALGIGGLSLGVAGLIAWLKKTKDVRKAKKLAKQAKNLEDAGWTVTPPIDLD